MKQHILGAYAPFALLLVSGAMAGSGAGSMAGSMAGSVAGSVAAAQPLPSHSAAQPAAQPAQDTSQDTTGGVRYMRTSGQAVVRNFPDRNGAALATVAPGTIVRSFRQSNGKPAFHEVEVGGGFPVWVHGAYLQPTDMDGILLVTGTRVNMRPLPELTSSSMPLRSKLDVGQRVRLIERANKAPSFADDWIRVQAPANTKAWVVASALVPTDPAKGRESWAAASAALPAARPRPASAQRSTSRTVGANGQAATNGAQGGTASAPAVTSDLMAKLADANRAWDAAEALRTPTAAAWRDVANLYETLMVEAPRGSVVFTNAERRLKDAEMRLQLEALREDLDASRQRTDEEIRQIDVYLDNKKRQRSARWGRFEERGWVEVRNVGGQERYYMTFGGETVAELRCQTSRYDLGMFKGFEIGVIGREVAPVVRATTNTLAEARIVDASRIEVISGSGRRR